VDARCHLLRTLSCVEGSHRLDLFMTGDTIQQIVRRLNDLEVALRVAYEQAREDPH
jgi:hypothetical protein